MKEAINKAIEGGYAKYMPFYSREDDRARPNVFRERNPIFERELSDAEVTSEPIFWQALGKQQGWPTGKENIPGFIYEKLNWLGRWHSFIDHLAEGGSVDKFFEDLLK